MENLISLIIFTLPGLLAYFWINLFGLTPTTKRDSSEVVAISALLWIPIVVLVLLIYQLLAWISNWNIIDPSFDVPLLKQDWMLIGTKISDINKLSESIWFLIFYVLTSIFISFYIASFITSRGYSFMLDAVNRVREKNGVARLSQRSTVWHEMFLNNTGQIVEYTKVEDSKFSIIGCLKKVPRAHEPDKGIVLEAVDHWSKIMEYYEVRIENVYIDSNTGSIIKIYNFDEALKAQELYNEKVQNGSIS